MLDLLERGAHSGTLAVTTTAIEPPPRLCGQGDTKTQFLLRVSHQTQSVLEADHKPGSTENEALPPLSGP